MATWNRGEGTRIIFWWGVRLEVWNPYPYLRIFLPQKTADLKLFSNFRKSGPISKGFSTSNGWFYHFFAIFAKWDPLLRIFLTKMGPMSKDFCWKSNPFGWHIPVCLNMWVPPGTWNPSIFAPLWFIRQWSHIVFFCHSRCRGVQKCKSQTLYYLKKYF